MAESLKNQTAKGLLWGGLSNGLVQLLGALFGIVMLRNLTPGDYGKIAVLLVFSAIASNLQESGFVAALCNKKEPKHEDYNAVFWFNIIVSVSVYVILWVASPFIADFYHDETLTPLARYLFLGFLMSGFGTVQRAYVFGHLMVKQNSIIIIVALLVSNVIGVSMVLYGFAYWGLATQSVAYIAVTTLLYWRVSPWRPTFHIVLRPAWQMFGFSSKLLITNLFYQLNSHVFSVLLGRFFLDKGQTVGNYSNARKWNDMAAYTIVGMVQGVAQPVLAKVVEDDSRYRAVFRKMLRFVSFVSFPCMLGLGLVAREFILITVGEKWIHSAFLLSMLCVYGAFTPITTLYSNMAISRGNSGINMFCNVALCVVNWVGLIVCRPFGLYYMVTFFVVVNVLWLLVWSLFAWRMVRLSVVDALKDIMPFFLLASLVMSATWFATRGIDNIYLSFVCKVLMAVTLYVGLTYISGAKIMRESIGYLRKKKEEE